MPVAVSKILLLWVIPSVAITVWAICTFIILVVPTFANQALSRISWHSPILIIMFIAIGLPMTGILNIIFFFLKRLIAMQ